MSSVRTVGAGKTHPCADERSVVARHVAESQVARAARERAAAVAARVKSEEALGESEERTRLIVAHALDAVITIDLDGRITSWNPQAERLFGWPQDAILGRLLSETAIPVAHREAHERGLAHFRTTGEGPVLNQRIELTALHRDGREFPIELAITPIPVKGTTVFSAFVRDITAQKQAEETHRQSAASFHLLFASNPLPMFVYDLATLYFLEVNDAAMAHYGYTREEFLRMRVTDIGPPEDLPRVQETLAELAAGRERTVRRYAQSWRHRRKDGQIRDVDIVGHPLDFAGRRARLIVVIDVTELKHTEASLAKSTARLEILHEIDRSIIAAETPEAMAATVLPRLRDLLEVPRAIVNLFDLDAGEVEWLAAAGRRHVRVGPGVRYSLRLAGDVAALRRGEPQVVDVESLPAGPEADALRASGLRSYMVVPMIAAGELIGSVSFGGTSALFPPEQVSIAQEVATQLAIAITQARLHDRVKRQTEELEERVKERTLELSDANHQLQLEIAERQRLRAEADRANRAKSEFLSRMSHELRTPLNGIIGFAQLLELDALDMEQRESVEHILKGGRHLLTLINEVLDIARIEADRLSISLETVLACDAVRGALDLVRPQATTRGVALPETIAWETYVMADRQRLQQVLLNLLSNAVKYNHAGGRVSVSCVGAPSGRVRITVSDTGRGIAPAMLDRLYTPFDRLGADELGVEGTGLGLALSKRLVEAMGGTLGVESKLAEGTTFTVELPGAEAPSPTPGQLAETASDSDTVDTRGTVLYIEDNLANVRLLERIVSRRPGLMLLSAMQGSRGLELARDHRPGVIILDLHLPDLPGGEVLARLRDDPRTRDIPVVILSADATPGQIETLLAQGARAYLTKPVDVTEVLGLLDKLFNRTGG